MWQLRSSVYDIESARREVAVARDSTHSLPELNIGTSPEGTGKPRSRAVWEQWSGVGAPIRAAQCRGGASDGHGGCSSGHRLGHTREGEAGTKTAPAPPPRHPPSCQDLLWQKELGCMKSVSGRTGHGQATKAKEKHKAHRGGWLWCLHLVTRGPHLRPGGRPGKVVWGWSSRSDG